MIDSLANNSLTKGCLFAASSISGQLVDVVNRSLAVPVSAANSEISAQSYGRGKSGMAWESNSNTNGGAKFPNTFSVSNKLDGGNEISLLWFGKLDALENWGHIFCAPWAEGSWASPYEGFNLSLYPFSSPNYAPMVSVPYPTASQRQVHASSVAVPTGIPVLISASVAPGSTSTDTSNCRIYQNGASLALTRLSGDMTQTIDTNGTDVYTLSRNTDALGEGLNGKTWVCAVWNRALSDREHIALYRDPWQLFQPKTAKIYNFPSVATKGTGPFTRHAQHGGVRQLYGSFASKVAASGASVPISLLHRNQMRHALVR